MDVGSILRQNCNEKVEEGLNKLLNVELQVSHLLQAMSFYFDTYPGLKKSLKFLSKRAEKHYNRLLTHMSVRGFSVVFEDIAKPSVEDWGTPLTAVMTGLDILKNLDETWMQVRKLTIKFGDPCTEVLLTKIMCEHAALMKIIGCHFVNLKRIGDDDPTGLYLYDTYSFKGVLIPKGDILDTDTDTMIH
jgi:ferritin